MDTSKATALDKFVNAAEYDRLKRIERLAGELESAVQAIESTGDEVSGANTVVTDESLNSVYAKARELKSELEKGVTP